MFKQILILVMLIALGCGGPKTPAELAQSQFKAGRFADAEQSAKLALQSDPNNYELYRLLGHIKMNLAAKAHSDQEGEKIVLAAIDDFTEAIKLSPRQPKPYQHRCDAYRRLWLTAETEEQRDRLERLATADEEKGDVLARYAYDTPSAPPVAIVLEEKTESPPPEPNASDESEDFAVVRDRNDSYINYGPSSTNAPDGKQSKTRKPAVVDTEPLPTNLRPENPVPTDLKVDVSPVDPIADPGASTLFQTPRSELANDNFDLPIPGAIQPEWASSIREEVRNRRERSQPLKDPSNADDQAAAADASPRPAAPRMWNRTIDGRQLYGAQSNGPWNLSSGPTYQTLPIGRPSVPGVLPSGVSAPFGNPMPATTGINSFDYVGMGANRPTANLGPVTFGPDGRPHNAAPQFPRGSLKQGATSNVGPSIRSTGSPYPQSTLPPISPSGTPVVPLPRPSEPPSFGPATSNFVSPR